MKKTMELTRSLAGRVYNAARVSWNGSRPRTKLAVVTVPLTTVAISVFAAALMFPSQVLANNDDEVSTFTVDVSLTPVYKQNNVDPSEGQDVFSPGDTFFQEGTIYPPVRFRAARLTTIPMRLEGSASIYRVEFLPEELRILKRRPTVSRVRNLMWVS